jgi:hypothetical protein
MTSLFIEYIFLKFFRLKSRQAYGTGQGKTDTEKNGICRFLLLQQPFHFHICEPFIQGGQPAIPNIFH